MVMWWPCVEAERTEKRGSAGDCVVVEGAAVVGWLPMCGPVVVVVRRQQDGERGREKREERSGRVSVL